MEEARSKTSHPIPCILTRSLSRHKPGEKVWCTAHQNYPMRDRSLTKIWTPAYKKYWNDFHSHSDRTRVATIGFERFAHPKCSLSHSRHWGSANPLQNVYSSPHLYKLRKNVLNIYIFFFREVTRAPMKWSKKYKPFKDDWSRKRRRLVTCGYCCCCCLLWNKRSCRTDLLLVGELYFHVIRMRSLGFIGPIL